jgi:hypothetical protein
VSSFYFRTKKSWNFVSISIFNITSLEDVLFILRAVLKNKERCSILENFIEEERKAHNYLIVNFFFGELWPKGEGLAIGIDLRERHVRDLDW